MQAAESANDEHNNRNMHQTVWNVGGERVDGHADEQVGVHAGDEHADACHVVDHAGGVHVA